MPILHVQFAGKGLMPDGNWVDVPPPLGLMSQGPCVQVSLGVPQSLGEQLLQQGKQVPTPITGSGLIDTGASTTCIDAEAAEKLGLQVIDTAIMASASHQGTRQNIYPARIEILGANINIEAPRAMGAALAAHGLLVLIGRDMLHNCVLFYNGMSGEITLAAG